VIGRNAENRMYMVYGLAFGFMLYVGGVPRMNWTCPRF
jgi:hypothetical protein